MVRGRGRTRRSWGLPVGWSMAGVVMGRDWVERGGTEDGVAAVETRITPEDEEDARGGLSMRITSRRS